MQWLDEEGFEAVTLDQVEEAWYEKGRLPPKPVVVSFDDGYPSQYSSGFAALEKRDWPGVLNLVARGSELPDVEVEKMLDAGWELASKATTNVDLTTLDSTTLEQEVAGSRRILRRRFGVSREQLLLSARPLQHHGDLGRSQGGLRGRPDADRRGRGRVDSLHHRSDPDPALGRARGLRLEAPVGRGGLEGD